MRLLIASALALLFALPAHGQNLEWQDFDIAAGGAVQYRPDYLGSDDYEIGFAPKAELAWQKTLFVSTQHGAGVYIVDTPKSRFGASIAPNFGRDDSINSHLAGLGDIGFGWDMHVFGELAYAPFIAGATAKVSVGGDAQGQTVDAYMGLRKDLAPNLIGQMTVSTTWASGTWGQAYYGVTTAQAISSGLAAHNVGSGFRDVGLGGQLTYSLSPQLALIGSARWNHLLGDVGDSPIVRNGDNLTIGAGFSYQFAAATTKPGN